MIPKKIKINLSSGQLKGSSNRCSTNKGNIVFKTVNVPVNGTLRIDTVPTSDYEVKMCKGTSQWMTVNTHFAENIQFHIQLNESCTEDLVFDIEYQTMSHKSTNFVQLTDSNGQCLDSSNGALVVELRGQRTERFERFERSERTEQLDLKKDDDGNLCVTLNKGIDIDIPLKDITILGNKQIPIATDSKGRMLIREEKYNYMQFHNGLLAKSVPTAKVDCRNFSNICIYGHIEEREGHSYTASVYVSPDGEDFFELKEIHGSEKKDIVCPVNVPIGYLRVVFDSDTKVTLYCSMC